MEPSHQKKIATLFLSMSKEDYQSVCLVCLRVVLECFRNDLKLILRISSKSFLKLSSTSKVFFDYFFSKASKPVIEVFFSENLIQVFQKRLQEPHPLKATFQMLVTEAGMLMLFKDLHSAKALSPMFFGPEDSASMVQQQYCYILRMWHHEDGSRPWGCGTVSCRKWEGTKRGTFHGSHCRREPARRPTKMWQICCLMCEKWQREDYKRKTAHGPRCQRRDVPQVLVTESRMLMLSKDSHSAKALPPMLV